MGRRLRLLLALATLASAASALEREPWQVYRERRVRLAAAHADGAVLLLGYSDRQGRPGPSRFRQENNFYYLTGCNEPDAALLLLPARGDKAYSEILFLPQRGDEDALWSGPGIDPDGREVAAATGVAENRPRSELETVVRRRSKRYANLYTLLPAERQEFGSPVEPDRQARVEELAGDAEIQDLRAELATMRAVKSAGELALIQQAVDATVDAHLEAWKRIRPGLFEYQAAAPMIGVMLERGCLRAAYPPIVGAGRNSLILHYSENEAPMAAGELVLIDVGGEYAHYAADLTRTVPVSGRFSARQREVYQTVLEVQRKVIAAVRPGMTLAGEGPKSLTALAEKAFDDAKDGLSQHFRHGVSHHVGLEVHDPANARAELAEGMVITVEPGLYLPEDGFGIRIEDMLVVTADGARLLSGRLPRSVEAIEEAMAK